MSFRCSPCRLAGILLAALFVPGLAAAAGSCERLVATGNPEYPPYLWRDPQDPKRLIEPMPTCCSAWARSSACASTCSTAAPGRRPRKR